MSTFIYDFDEDNVNWLKEAELNLMFLKASQVYINHLLFVKSMVCLNEVHDMLGFPRTKEGYIYGWVTPSRGISFGIEELRDSRFRLRINPEGIISEIHYEQVGL